jgi:hypothetical protein
MLVCADRDVSDPHHISSILTITSLGAENFEVIKTDRHGLTRQSKESGKEGRDLVKETDEEKKVKRRKMVAEARKHLQEFAGGDVETMKSLKFLKV